MLLILAGVALATLTGQGNIIGNAENAVGKYNNSVASEQQLLNEIEKYFQNYLEGGNEDNPPTPTIPEVDENGLAIDNVTITTDEENVQIVIPAGFAPAILKGSDSTYSLPGQDGSVKEIMPAEEWYSITAEQINQGIVIVDNAITYDSGQPTGTIPDFNEYVWVPIPDMQNLGRTSWNSAYWLEGYIFNKHPISNEPTTNYFFEDMSINQYTDMIESIEQYKGFYIGRYEASNDGNGRAQSKRNITPWISVSYLTSSAACQNENQENMHLIYGIEWDSTLNWLIENAEISSEQINVTRKMRIEDIETNSSTWGNYKNSVGNATYGCNQFRITGYNEAWKANNIYDLAGNVYEWTQEHYSNQNLRTLRGGNYTDEGADDPVSIRVIHEESFVSSGIYYARISC